MRRLLIAALVAAAAGVAGMPAVAGPYAHDSRIDHVGRALVAVQALGAGGRAALERELYEGARADCRAGLGVPPLSCLLALARRTCDARPAAERDGCHRVADVLLTNSLGETELVDEQERMRLLASSTDYRAALRERLARRYAALAADLALVEPGTEAELPARIDRFCAGRERRLAWQRCVAALVWWIGSHEGGNR